MKHRSALAGGILFAALMVTGADVQAVQVTVMRISNHDMQAQFVLEDPVADCFFASTTVQFFESMTRTNGVETEQPPTVVVDITYENDCTGDVFVLNGASTQLAFGISRDLSLGTLTAQVPVNDGNGLTLTANLGLVFTADGPVQRAQNSSRSHDNGTIFISSVREAARSAVATGSLSVVFPLSTGAATVELAPQGSESASIGKSASGSLTIITR